MYENLINNNCSHVYHLYVISVSHRDKLIEHMNNNGIYPGIHYPLPVHKHTAFQNILSHSMDTTEMISSNIISLPMYPELDINKVEFILDVISNYIS